MQGWMKKKVAILLLAASAGAAAQQQQKSDAGKAASETHLTQAQADELFRSVDTLMKFAADDSGLPMAGAIKKKLISRTEVEHYLEEKFNEDESAKRMQRSEIVLKKFGLLDRDFDLKPFLLALLKEQIAGFYDSKTKTVNMLDWLDAESQKPVLVHELTHALQDQHTNLDKWGDQAPSGLSRNVREDNDHVAKDEMDDARDAVLEGQAMAVYMDYMLKPTGKSLVGNPEVLDAVEEGMNGTDDSPVLARAPLLLKESLLFPYREGLGFEQRVWIDKGKQAAFVGVLDQPPSSSWEIMNPRSYEKRVSAPLLLMPDIHPLVDKTYRAYDIGQIGQLDVRILSQLFGGDETSARLTAAWDGGIYWAGQRLDAKSAAELGSTKSIAFFYASSWKSTQAAVNFAAMYARSLGRRYGHVKEADADAANAVGLEQVFTTDEGPVLIATRGKQVFVAESFELGTARRLGSMVMDAQGDGEMHTAAVHPQDSISGAWRGFFAKCGVMKAVLGY